MILRFTLCKDGSFYPVYDVYDVSNFCFYPDGVGIVHLDGSIQLIDSSFAVLEGGRIS